MVVLSVLAIVLAMIQVGQPMWMAGRARVELKARARAMAHGCPPPPEYLPFRIRLAMYVSWPLLVKRASVLVTEFGIVGGALAGEEAKRIVGNAYAACARRYLDGGLPPVLSRFQWWWRRELEDQMLLQAVAAACSRTAPIAAKLAVEQ